jgi:hypothetical protein
VTTCNIQRMLYALFTICIYSLHGPIYKHHTKHAIVCMHSLQAGRAYVYALWHPDNRRICMCTIHYTYIYSSAFERVFSLLGVDLCLGAADGPFGWGKVAGNPNPGYRLRVSPLCLVLCLEAMKGSISEGFRRLTPQIIIALCGNVANDPDTLIG